MPILLGPMLTIGALAALDYKFGSGLNRGKPEGAEAAAETSAAPSVPELESSAVREVTPMGVTPSPALTSPLVRIDPTPPAGVIELGNVDRGVIYRRVKVIDGGSFGAVQDKREVVIRLAGIAAPGVDDTCTDEKGTVWRCGAKARAELARLIGPRAVECDGGAPREAESVTRCRVGRQDLSEWLVEMGWADPAEGADPALAARAEGAKDAKRGRHGAAPSGIVAG